MGIRLPHGNVDRAKITYTTAYLGGVDVGNLKPHALLYVRNSNAEYRKLFRQCVIRCGLTIVETLEIGDKDEFGHCPTLCCRVVGTADSLESAVCHSVVIRWEYVTNARVGFKAAGSGPDKVRPSASKPGKPSKVSVTQYKSLSEAIAASYHTDKPITSI